MLKEEYEAYSYTAGSARFRRHHQLQIYFFRSCKFETVRPKLSAWALLYSRLGLCRLHTSPTRGGGPDIDPKFRL